MSEHPSHRKRKTPAHPLTTIGCLVVAIPVVILAAPFIFAFTLWDDYRAAALRREFRRRWPGKRGILVYSNSPNWQRYIEDHWIPRIGAQFVVLNWSDRATWPAKARFEARVFRRFAGDREFNPIAIVFLPRARAARFRAWLRGFRHGDALGMLLPGTTDTAVIRFFQAFKDFKHGKDHLLRTREAELFSLCAAAMDDD